MTKNSACIFGPSCRKNRRKSEQSDF